MKCCQYLEWYEVLMLAFVAVMTLAAVTISAAVMFGLIAYD